MEPDSSATVEVEGVQIVCRTIGIGPPLLVLNGFAATSADWDPCFIDRLASRHAQLQRVTCYAPRNVVVTR